MFDILLLSFLATFFYTPYGYLFQKGNNLRSYSLQLIFGLIVLSFFSLFINFFSPLNKVLNTTFLIFGLILIFYFKHIYFKKKYFIFCLYSSIIIFLLITVSNVYRPDAGLYHLPYINILNEEKIIIGLSNLHFRFGHTSILQYTSAILNNLIFNNHGISYPSALISSAVIINFLSNLNHKYKKQIYDLHFFIVFSFIIFIFYKINRYSEYGNDAPAHLLMFLLISEIIKNINNSKTIIFNYFLISFFILMNKIILSFSIFFPVALFFKKEIKFKIFKIKNLFLVFFISIWILKNVLVSGCALYPVKITCFEKLKWTDSKEVVKISTINEAWAKGWPDFRKNNINKLNEKEYSENFNWIKTWSKNHLLKITKILVPYLIFLFLILYLSKSKIKTNLKPIKNYLRYIFFVSALGTAIWIYKVPVFRYGYSYPIILLSLFFGFISQYFDYKKNLKFFLKYSIIIMIGVFVLKNLTRIILYDNKYYDYPWPKIYSMQENNILDEPSSGYIKNKKFYYTNKNYCMYGYSPCGISIKNLNYENFLNYSLIYKKIN